MKKEATNPLTNDPAAPPPNELAALVAYLADGGPAGAREKLAELLALESLIFRGRTGPMEFSERDVAGVKLLHVIADHLSDFSLQKRA